MHLLKKFKGSVTKHIKTILDTDKAIQTTDQNLSLTLIYIF